MAALEGFYGRLDGELLVWIIRGAVVAFGCVILLLVFLVPYIERDP
jgi:hypothetical protein